MNVFYYKFHRQLWDILANKETYRNLEERSAYYIKQKAFNILCRRNRGIDLTELHMEDHLFCFACKYAVEEAPINVSQCKYCPLEGMNCDEKDSLYDTFHKLIARKKYLQAREIAVKIRDMDVKPRVCFGDYGE